MIGELDEFQICSVANIFGSSQGLGLFEAVNAIVPATNQRLAGSAIAASAAPSAAASAAPSAAASVVGPRSQVDLDI